MKKFITLLFCFYYSMVHSGDIVPQPELLFVGNGSGQCSYTSIQEAIDDAPPNSEIRVTTELDSFNENLSISKSLEIKGGYSSCGLAQLDNRIETNKSIIDGGGNSTTLTVVGNNLTVSLSGLSIRNGQSAGINPAGGITFSGSNSEYNLNHVYVTNNTGVYGGGIYIGGESLLNLSNTQVFINEAVSGGGVHCAFNAEVNLFDGSKINYNHAQNGGGVFADECIVNLRSGTPKDEGAFDSGVSFNSADDNGGGIYLDASTLNFLAAEMASLGPTQMAENVTNIDGDNVSAGGAIYADGGSQLNLGFAYFLNNKVINGLGGAIFLRSSEIDNGLFSLCKFYSDRCLYFEGNKSQPSIADDYSTGGAIYALNSSRIGSGLHPFKGYFKNNRADHASAIAITQFSLAFIQNSYFVENGAVENDEYEDSSVFLIEGLDSEVYISFSTFANNKTSVIFDHEDTGSTNLSTSIVYDESNEYAVIDDVVNNVEISCTMVHEVSSLVNGLYTVLLADDPGFQNVNTGNYHITANSLAIDLCEGTLSAEIRGDRDGDSRGSDFINPNNGNGDFDAGADEYNDVIFKSGFDPASSAGGL